MEGETDPRLVEVCRHIARIYPRQRFMVVFVPMHKGQQFSTMANMSEAAQLEVCRALVLSFENGRAKEQERLTLEGESL